MPMLGLSPARLSVIAARRAAVRRHAPRAGGGSRPRSGPVGMISLAQLLEEHLVTALFLDRDGVINVKAPPGQYITSPEELALLAGAAAAIRHANELGIPVFVVTNQRWVAGHPDGIERLRAIHLRLGRLLSWRGAQVDGIYACVHEINRCSCRKPERGLVDQALRDNPALALSSSAMVGDAETDIELASRCGMHAVRLFDDKEKLQHSAGSTRAHEVAADLYSAVVGECGRAYQPIGAYIGAAHSAGDRARMADHRRKERKMTAEFGAGGLAATAMKAQKG